MKYAGHRISTRYDSVKVTLYGRSFLGRRVERSATFPRYKVQGKSDRQLLKMVAKQTKYFWNIPFIL